MNRKVAASAMAIGLVVAGCTDHTGPVEPELLAPRVSFSGVAGAAFTTNNPGVDGVDADGNAVATCLNGPQGGASSSVNCNIYGSKQFVWINGGPSSSTASSLTDGTYFFAVLQPGGQNQQVNDGTGAGDDKGTDHNLSDEHDSYLNRTFTVSGGNIATYAGNAANGEVPHDVSGTNPPGRLIRLMPYSDTPNNGGVYILAMCKYVPGSYDPATAPVDPKSCKYDAFKVHTTTGTFDPNFALDVQKTATPSYVRTYNWKLEKSCTPAALTGGYILHGGTTTAACTATASATFTDGGWKVTGDITITNNSAVGSDASANALTVSDVVDLLKDPTDTRADYTTAVIDPACASFSLDAGATKVCSYTIALNSAPLGYDATTHTFDASQLYVNTATAQGAHGSSSLAFESNPVSFSFADATMGEVDKCITIADLTIDKDYKSAPICYGDAKPSVDLPTWTITAPSTCGPYTAENTATFVTATSATSGSSNSVKLGYTVDGCSRLTVKKFYDQNGNGAKDAGESWLDGATGSFKGWPVTINSTAYTTTKTLTDQVSGSYSVAEGAAAGWRQTALYAGNSNETLTKLTTAASTSVLLPINGDKTVVFGNTCSAAAGGWTMGFWSNKNGQAILGVNDPAWRTLLNGGNAYGPFKLWQASASKNGTIALQQYVVPTAGTFTTAYGSFNTWILGAQASSNGSALYMLSGQFSAALLNIQYGGTAGVKLSPADYYAPAGMTVDAIMTNAAALLNAGSTDRTALTTYITWINALNNKANVSPATPCAH